MGGVDGRCGVGWQGLGGGGHLVRMGGVRTSAAFTTRNLKSLRSRHRQRLFRQDLGQCAHSHLFRILVGLSL